MRTIVVTGCTGAVGNAAVRMLHVQAYTVIGTTCREPKNGERYLDLASVVSCYTARFSILHLFRSAKYTNIPRRWLNPELAAWLWEETEGE